SPQLTLRPSRLLVASMQLLALPSLALERLVERELAENPALERAETVRCRRCGSEHGAAERCVVCAIAPPPACDPVAAVAAEPGLAESLAADVFAEVEERDRPLAAYLLGCLDEHGFLELDGLADERVEAVVHAIQACGPPGVGARDVRECLLLQLERLAPDSAHTPPV